LQISSPLAMLEKVEVHDLMGRKVTTVSGKSNASLKLDLSGLNSSVYFVTVTTDQGTVTKRVIKE
ncbi:T9SS type A sorting domain-containing protein, partial [Aureisphaera sp.]